MKTRREFFRTLAGSCAVLAACVIAPKSLSAQSKVFQIEHPEPYNHITSGYANITDLEPLKKLIKTFHPNASGVNVRGPNGLTSFYWTKGT